MIRDFFKRRRAIKPVARAVPIDFMEWILANPQSGDSLKLRKRQVEFVVVAVRGQTPEVIKERMGAVCDMALAHHGLVDHLISSIVVVVYGMVLELSEPTKDRMALIKALEEALDNDIKIVHGTGVGHVGDIGSESRSDFSFILPGFLNALGMLANMNFGENMEITCVQEL